ncbi:hypothetical protein JBO41_22475 [Enterobacter asburiae]|uniref:hypothetical protein n=1 Tax=Enterobacter asburiae TaxID=61645 RepID=UPI00192BE5C4|nr:hypothetical protein [Enterobacter asburiae]MBL5914896.1 hypothetical protein [Enterobacter asburiae]MBL5919377.1 hypothetical protein [Enterobacter asburiae]
MTVNTRTISLSGEWQQITDGAKTSFIQVKSGVFEFVDADAVPLAETEGHTEGAGGKFSVTPPTQIWGRSSYGSIVARIVVTSS